MVIPGKEGGEKESLWAKGIFMTVSVSSQPQLQVTEGPNYAGTLTAGDRDLFQCSFIYFIGVVIKFKYWISSCATVWLWQYFVNSQKCIDILICLCSSAYFTSESCRYPSFIFRIWFSETQ